MTFVRVPPINITDFVPRETGELHAEVLMREKFPARLPEPPCVWLLMLDLDDDPGTGLGRGPMEEQGVPANRAGMPGIDLMLHATMAEGP